MFVLIGVFIAAAIAAIIVDLLLDGALGVVGLAIRAVTSPSCWSGCAMVAGMVVIGMWILGIWLGHR